MDMQGKDRDDLDALIAAFEAKGGKVTRGKTKPMAPELGISNNTWGNKLSREENQARQGTEKKK